MYSLYPSVELDERISTSPHSTKLAAVGRTVRRGWLPPWVFCTITKTPRQPGLGARVRLRSDNFPGHRYCSPCRPPRTAPPSPRGPRRSVAPLPEGRRHPLHDDRRIVVCVAERLYGLPVLAATWPVSAGSESTIDCRRKLQLSGRPRTASSRCRRAASGLPDRCRYAPTRKCASARASLRVGSPIRRWTSSGGSACSLCAPFAIQSRSAST
jgi:hypothetical protein